MSHSARQQKKLAKQKAKRKEKRTLLARQSSKDPTLRFAAAAAWPIIDSLIGEGIWEQGLAMVVLSRRMPNGGVAMASMIVDVYCLGVKDCFVKTLSSFEYLDYLGKVGRSSNLLPVAPEYLVKLVTEAAAYARSIGFAPHSDFRNATLLFAGIDPGNCGETFAFGKDGKPLYIRGPNESIAKAHSIASRVEHVGGHFVIPMDPSGLDFDGVADEFDDDFDDELDDDELDDGDQPRQFGRADDRR